jgi:hypothetical protein
MGSIHCLAVCSSLIFSILGSGASMPQFEIGNYMAQNRDFNSQVAARAARALTNQPL